MVQIKIPIRITGKQVLLVNYMKKVAFVYKVIIVDMIMPFYNAFNYRKQTKPEPYGEHKAFAC